MDDERRHHRPRGGGGSSGRVGDDADDDTPPPPPPAASSSPGTGTSARASAVADTLRRYLDRARGGDRGGGGGGGRDRRRHTSSPSAPSPSPAGHRRRWTPPPRREGYGGGGGDTTDRNRRQRQHGRRVVGPNNPSPNTYIMSSSPSAAGGGGVFDLHRLASAAAAATTNTTTGTGTGRAGGGGGGLGGGGGEGGTRFGYGPEVGARVTEEDEAVNVDDLLGLRGRIAPPTPSSGASRDDGTGAEATGVAPGGHARDRGASAPAKATAASELPSGVGGATRDPDDGEADADGGDGMIAGGGGAMKEVTGTGTGTTEEEEEEGHELSVARAALAAYTAGVMVAGAGAGAGAGEEASSPSPSSSSAAGGGAFSPKTVREPTKNADGVSSPASAPPGSARVGDAVDVVDGASSPYGPPGSASSSPPDVGVGVGVTSASSSSSGGGGADGPPALRRASSKASSPLSLSLSVMSVSSGRNDEDDDEDEDGGEGEDDASPPPTSSRDSASKGGRGHEGGRHYDSKENPLTGRRSADGDGDGDGGSRSPGGGELSPRSTTDVAAAAAEAPGDPSAITSGDGPDGTDGGTAGAMGAGGGGDAVGDDDDDHDPPRPPREKDDEEEEEERVLLTCAEVLPTAGGSPAGSGGGRPPEEVDEDRRRGDDLNGRTDDASADADADAAKDGGVAGAGDGDGDGAGGGEVEAEAGAVEPSPPPAAAGMEVKPPSDPTRATSSSSSVDRDDDVLPTSPPATAPGPARAGDDDDLASSSSTTVLLAAGSGVDGAREDEVVFDRGGGFPASGGGHVLTLTAVAAAAAATSTATATATAGSEISPPPAAGGGERSERNNTGVEGDDDGDDDYDSGGGARLRGDPKISASSSTDGVDRSVVVRGPRRRLPVEEELTTTPVTVDDAATAAAAKAEGDDDAKSEGESSSPPPPPSRSEDRPRGDDGGATTAGTTCASPVIVAATSARSTTQTPTLSPPNPTPDAPSTEAGAEVEAEAEADADADADADAPEAGDAGAGGDRSPSPPGKDHRDGEDSGGGDGDNGDDGDRSKTTADERVGEEDDDGEDDVVVVDDDDATRRRGGEEERPRGVDAQAQAHALPPGRGGFSRRGRTVDDGPVTTATDVGVASETATVTKREEEEVEEEEPTVEVDDVVGGEERSDVVVGGGCPAPNGDASTRSLPGGRATAAVTVASPAAPEERGVGDDSAEDDDDEAEVDEGEGSGDGGGGANACAGAGGTAAAATTTTTTTTEILDGFDVSNRRHNDEEDDVGEAGSTEPAADSPVEEGGVIADNTTTSSERRAVPSSSSSPPGEKSRASDEEVMEGGMIEGNYAVVVSSSSPGGCESDGPDERDGTRGAEGSGGRRGESDVGGPTEVLCVSRDPTTGGGGEDGDDDEEAKKDEVDDSMAASGEEGEHANNDVGQIPTVAAEPDRLEVQSPRREESSQPDRSAPNKTEVKGEEEFVAERNERAQEETAHANEKHGTSTMSSDEYGSEMNAEHAEEDAGERKKGGESRTSGATVAEEHDAIPRRGGSTTRDSSSSLDIAHSSADIDTTPLPKPDVEEESSDIADGVVEESDSDSEDDSDSDDDDDSCTMMEHDSQHASSSSLPTVTSCRAFSGNVNGDHCDICNRGVDDDNLLQSCRSCGVVVHEMCYGIAHHTSRPSRNWECLACDARHWKPVVTDVVDGKTGRVRNVRLRTSERPTECVLCSVQHSIHAMHPLYDTNGKDGKQVVLAPTEDKPRRLAWVHSLCAFYIGSHPRTRGSTYACDKDGAWSGEVEDGDGVNEEVDESEEDEGNSNKLESTHHFVINHEPGWTGVIGKFRKLSCYVCGICPEDHRRDKGPGGEVPALALSIPIQCSAGDKYEMEEVARRRRSGRCCRAMHVGCARWGAMRKKTTEAGATEVYHMESGGHLGFHPGSNPNRDDDLVPKKGRSSLKALGDGSGEEVGLRRPRGDPVTLCYCHTHAASLPSWLTGSSPKATVRKKKAPQKDDGSDDDAPPRKRQRTRRGRPDRPNSVGRLEKKTSPSSHESLTSTGQDDRNVAETEQPNEGSVPKPNETKVISSKANSDGRNLRCSRNQSSVDDDKLAGTCRDNEGGEDVDSVTSVESKESGKQANPDGKSIEPAVSESEESDGEGSLDHGEEQPHGSHSDDDKEGDGGEGHLRPTTSMSITDESSPSPPSSGTIRRTQRKTSEPIYDIPRSPTSAKECPICHRYFQAYGYHQHYASCKKYQHWTCDGCGCDRDSFRPQKTESGPNGKDTLCHDCGANYRKNKGTKRWTRIKRSRDETKIAPDSVSVDKEVNVATVRRSRRIKIQEEEQVASWMQEYADLDRVDNEREQEERVERAIDEVKGTVTKRSRDRDVKVRRFTRSAMANVSGPQSEEGKFDSREAWQWLDAEEIALLLVVLLKGKYIVQRGAGEWIYTSVGKDLDLVRGDDGSAAPTQDEILTKWNELMSRSTGKLLSDSPSQNCARHVMSICLDDMIQHNTSSPENAMNGTRAVSLVHAGWQMVTTETDVADEGECVMWHRPISTPPSSLLSRKQETVSSGLSLAEAWKEHTNDLRAKLERDLSSFLGQKPCGGGQYLVRRAAQVDGKRKLHNIGRKLGAEEHVEAEQDEAEQKDTDDDTSEDKIEEEKIIETQSDSEGNQGGDDIVETEALGMTRTYRDLLMDGLIPANVAKRLKERSAYVIEGDPRPFPDCCWCGPKWSDKRTKKKKVNRKDSNKPSCRACRILYHDGWRMFAVRRDVREGSSAKGCKDGWFDHRFKTPEGKHVHTAKQFLKDTTHYVAELLAEEEASSRTKPKRKATTAAERQRKKQHKTKQDSECELERGDRPRCEEAQTKESSTPVFKNNRTEKLSIIVPPFRLPTIDELLLEKGGLHGILAVDGCQTWRYSHGNEMDIAAQVLETLTTGELPSIVQQETPFLRSKEEVLSLSSKALAPVTRFFGTTRIVEERILGVENEMIRIQATPTDKFGVEFPVFRVDEASVNGGREIQRLFPPRAASVAGHKVLLRMDITTEVLAGQLYTFVYRLLFGSAAVEEVISRINPKGTGDFM